MMQCTFRHLLMAQPKSRAGQRSIGRWGICLAATKVARCLPSLARRRAPLSLLRLATLRLRLHLESGASFFSRWEGRGLTRPILSLLVFVKAAADVVQAAHSVVELAALRRPCQFVQHCRCLLLGYLLVAVHFAVEHVGDILSGHCAANLTQRCDDVADRFGFGYVAVGAVDGLEFDAIECVHCFGLSCLLLMYTVYSHLWDFASKCFVILGKTFSMAVVIR
jgi:hypothetical protein